MRTTWLHTFCLVALLAPGALLAQEGELFGKLDKNGDGQVAADEVEGKAKGIFERLVRNGDENKDGKLSQEEFTAGMRKRTAAETPDKERPAAPRINPEELFKRADANGDGKITKDEAPERLKPGFDRVDANSDGGIDKAEFGRAMGRLMGMAGQPGNAAPTPRPEFVVGAMILKALDADGNGQLSASEIADAPKALAKFDKDNDGKLDQEELLAQAPRPDARPGIEGMARRLKEADTNGDGKISKEETPERLQPLFSRIDANSDGQIDATEMREFVSRLQANQP